MSCGPTTEIAANVCFIGIVESTVETIKSTVVSIHAKQVTLVDRFLTVYSSSMDEACMK